MSVRLARRCAGGSWVRAIWNPYLFPYLAADRPYPSIDWSMMASGRGAGVRQTTARDEEGAKLRQLVQTLRSDLNMLSNEARKKYPAVREVSWNDTLIICTESVAVLGMS